MSEKILEIITVIGTGILIFGGFFVLWLGSPPMHDVNNNKSVNKIMRGY